MSLLLIKELKAPPKAKKKLPQPSDVVDPEEQKELILEVLLLLLGAMVT